MEVKSRRNNGRLYFLLKGELDEHTATYTREMMDRALTGGDFREVIIDLSELDFMDSTGVGVLIGRYKMMKSKNIPIYLYNPSNSIERIFKISGLYQIMPKIG